MDVIKNTIRTLEKHYDFLKQAWKPYPDPNVLNAIGSAVSLLEKQVPKKPTYVGYASGGTFVRDEWICPNCGSRHELEYDDYEYCPNCGQIIDWSENVAEEAKEE
nr:MAG TPA: rubrerythrin heme iron peroxidase [Caudoviricetes sp.]